MGKITVKHNGKRKAEHITVAISINKKLAQVINGIAVSDEKSRSRVITELLERGLEANGMVIEYGKPTDDDMDKPVDLSEIPF